MSSLDQPQNPWGKLTSLTPKSQSVTLTENPSMVLDHLQIEYQDKSTFFVKNNDSLIIHIGDQILQKDEVLQLHSGDRVTLMVMNWVRRTFSD